MDALIPETSTLVVWLIESTLMVSILVCVILAVRTLFARKLPAWWIYSLWLLLLFRILVPLNLETSFSIFNLVPEVSTDRAYIPYLQENGFYMPFLPSEIELADLPQAQEVIEGGGLTSEVSQPERNLSLEQILLFVWISGALVFALIILIKQQAFRAEIRDEPQMVDSAVLELLDQSKSLLAIHRDIPLIATNKVKSPAIYGYFKPRLLLPPNVAEALKKEELGFVFLHELGHLKRHDIGVFWLAAIVQCLYWFNPLVWVAFHNMRSDQEAACDAFVLSRLEQIRPESYANTIVNLLESYGQNRPVQALAGIVENKSQIKRRIKMIVDFRKFRPKETIISAVALASIGFVLFTNPLSVSAQTDFLPQADFSEMNQFVFRDSILISMDMPEHWFSRPLTRRDQIARFATDEDPLKTITIWESSARETLMQPAVGAQKSLANGGGENFATTERMVGSNQAVVLDFDRPWPHDDSIDTLFSRRYFMKDENSLLVLGFSSSDPASFEEFELMVASIEFSNEHSSNFARR